MIILEGEETGDGKIIQSKLEELPRVSPAVILEAEKPVAVTETEAAPPGVTCGAKMPGGEKCGEPIKKKYSAECPKHCGGKTRSGLPCPTRKMQNGRCRMHGGNQPHGVASPHFHHGRYSKYMPAKLRENYEIALKDPNLLAMRDGLALIDARLSELLERADSGAAGQHWDDLQEAWKEYRKAKNNGIAVAVANAEFGLGEAIEAGRRDTEAWREIATILEQRRKMSDAERKRLVDMNQMIRSEEALGLVMALVNSVKDNVKDRDALHRISQDVARLIGPSPGRSS